MGQGVSAETDLNRELEYIQKKFSSQVNVLNKITFLRYRELCEMIEELNTITRSFTDRSGKQLCFSIRKGTDTTVFWKKTVRMRCLKVNTTNKNIESSRLLTLRQFVIMYKEIKDQIAMLSVARSTLPKETPPPAVEEEDQQPQPSEQDEEETSDKKSEHSLATSSFFSMEDSCEDLTECCVCMDRKSCIMLSCTHEFCEPCIDSWTRDKDHSNCPLCRSTVSGSDDAWVLTDKKEGTNYENEVKGYLVGFADREDV